MNLRFGDYILDMKARQLRGPDGAVDIGARSFDILEALLSRPGELIGKDDLFAAAWPGIAVEENTLQVHVSSLRKVLGASAIVTVHGRGYKYVGPPPVPAGPDTPASRKGNGDKKPVIVVLPFDNLNGDPDQQYFSDGITADIADRLTAFRVFSVIGQYSAAAFRGSAPDLAMIRERLRADFVVTGNVRRAAERIRITVRLLDPMTGESIWADRHDRPISDLFDLQDEIGGLVAAALARHLEVEINVRNTVKTHANLSSYENMLQGYWHFKKLNRTGNLAARGCFERAVALDPGNAEAIAWLGVTYSEQWVQDFTAEDALRGAELASQAVALDPANAIIHAVRAWILMCVGDRAAAVSASERSMALNAGDPSVLINRALALGYDGDTSQALRLIALAHRLEPVPPAWFGEFAGVVCFAQGRYEDTLRGVESLADNAWDAMYALACYGHLGRAEQAHVLLGRLKTQGRSPDWDLGVSREAYRDVETRKLLAEGLKRALSF